MDWLVVFRDEFANWLPLLFGVLLILMVYILWRTLQVMPKVTAAKTISPKSTVSWDDVAGLDEAKEELAEVIDFLRDPEKFGRLGARVPKGLLLYGPPGTGKTLLAKAIAHEAGAKFFAQSASAFVEMFAGLGAARIRKLFEHARQAAGLTGAELENIANEAGIFAGRAGQQQLRQVDFDDAMERVVAGLQQRRVVTEKERRILAYHEAGHAVMSHLTGDLLPVHKVTIVSRGQALGYTLNLPSEERYLHTAEEFADLLKVYLSGRAAEQIVFGRVTNGAANDLEKATEVARAMVFDYGMSEASASRTVRADNYALSEETQAMRDHEQARLTDEAFAEAQRLLRKHRSLLDRVAQALLEKETLDKDELGALLEGVEAESHSSETVGTVRAVAAD